MSVETKEKKRLSKRKKNDCLNNEKKTTTSKCFVAFGIDFSSFSLVFSE